MIPDPGFQKPTPYLAAAVARKLYTSSFTSCERFVKKDFYLFECIIFEYWIKKNDLIKISVLLLNFQMWLMRQFKSTQTVRLGTKATRLLSFVCRRQTYVFCICYVCFVYATDCNKLQTHKILTLLLFFQFFVSVYVIILSVLFYSVTSTIKSVQWSSNDLYLRI